MIYSGQSQTRSLALTSALRFFALDCFIKSRLFGITSYHICSPAKPGL